MRELPAPSLAFLVASASMEQEIECLLRINPHMEFVIYTLDFRCAASLPEIFARYGIGETEVIQLSVSPPDEQAHLCRRAGPLRDLGQSLICPQHKNICFCAK